MKPSNASSGVVFGRMSSRTATVLLAILGIVFYVQAFTWLGSVSSSLPDGMEGQKAFVPSAFSAKYAHSAARMDQLMELGPPDPIDGANVKSGANNPNLPAWIAEAKAYLKAQGLSFTPTAAQAHIEHKISPLGSASDNAPSTDPLEYHPRPSDGAEDGDRMQWDTLRAVIGALRWYVVVSTVCCIAGVIGAMRAQLLLSRLFIIYSFLDLLLSTLSLLALAIVSTYPTVRAHLCDEFGSGEVHSWFSHTSTPASQFRSVGTSAGQILGLTSDNGVSLKTGGPMISAGLGKDLHASSSGWETVLDGVFGTENCEESFRTTVVPIFMLCGLLYTALRLQCFFLVQRFHASLLRNKPHQNGYIAASSVSSGNSTPYMPNQSIELRDRRWKEDKLLD